MAEGVDYTAFESLHDRPRLGRRHLHDRVHARRTTSTSRRVEGRGGDDTITSRRSPARPPCAATARRRSRAARLQRHRRRHRPRRQPGAGGRRHAQPDRRPAHDRAAAAAADTARGRRHRRRGANIGSLSSGTLAGLGMHARRRSARGPDLVQVITVRGVLDGRFQLKVGALTTDELDFDAIAGRGQGRARAAPRRRARSRSRRPATRFIVTFVGALAGDAGWAKPAMQAVSAAGFGLIAEGRRRRSCSPSSA